MATRVVTKDYNSGTDGLADAGNSANITFAANTGDGSPSADSLKFTTGAGLASSETEYARKTTTTDTWESIGFANPGETITNVRITNYKRRASTGVPATNSVNLSARITDASRANILSGDLLASVDVSAISASWGAGSAGTNRSVNGGSQASNSVALIEYQLTSDEPSRTTYIDTVEYTITYNPPGPQDIYPTGLAIPITLNAPVVSQPQDVSPVPLSMPMGFGDPVVRNQNDIYPVGLSIPMRMNEPSIGNSTGNQVLVPNGLYIPMVLNTPIVSPSGNLKFRQCRDNLGAVWTTEVVIAAADNGGAGCWLENRYGALYGAGGSVWWVTTPYPRDWTITAPVATSLEGKVISLARNNQGALLALLTLDSKVVNAAVSRDSGVTWAYVTDVPSSDAQVALVAVENAFVVTQLKNAGIQQYRSMDNGRSWL